MPRNRACCPPAPLSSDIRPINSFFSVLSVYPRRPVLAVGGPRIHEIYHGRWTIHSLTGANVVVYHKHGSIDISRSIRVRTSCTVDDMHGTEFQNATFALLVSPHVISLSRLETCARPVLRGYTCSRTTLQSPCYPLNRVYLDPLHSLRPPAPRCFLFSGI